MYILLHSCSSPHAVVVALCASSHTHAAGSSASKVENMDCIFSDVAVLYMNKWNGLDKDTLKVLSLPYTMK